MDLLTRFKQFINQNNLFSRKDKLLIAVSGGVDSIVLCELCKQAGYDFAIAHCNFQLRGEESNRDEEFVKDAGRKYGVEVMIKKFATQQYADERKFSVQEAARELRYTWFKEVINVNPKSEIPNPKYILTAHHADDNIETALMNFCRGTGLKGLEGIPVAQNKIRRPLLGFWKEELIEFAAGNKLEFVQDSSNLSSKYTRNFFRNEIIPSISKAYPAIRQNLHDNINRFKEIRRLYMISVNEIKKKLLIRKGQEIHIAVKQLMRYENRALIYDIISDYGFTEKHIDEVIKLADSESGKYIQSPCSPARIIKFRHWFIVSLGKSTEAATTVIEGIGSWELGVGNLVVATELNSKVEIPASANIACLDADQIKFPLIVRKWKEGDYFYPLGMNKKKKVARFFIDQKLSKTDRERILVLEMSKKIIWVVGLRIDNRFKVNNDTKRLLKVTFNTGQTG